MNGFFTLTWANVKSAAVYGALVLAASFVLSIAQSVLDAKSIFGLDWKNIVDTAVIATIPVGIAGLSLLKNLLTDSSGHFLGFFKVIPDNAPVEKTDDK